jgi:hypothetical protein
MKEITGMADEYLDNNIECLVAAGILKRCHQDMETGSIICLNLDYAPKKPRIKILAPVCH